MFYLLQVIVYTGLMWLLYWVLLRDKKLHAFNRVYLLLASIVPLLLPLLKLPWSIVTDAPTIYTGSAMLQEVIIGGKPVAANSEIGWVTIVVVTYLLITTLLLVRWTVNYIRVSRSVWKYQQSDRGDYVVLTNTTHGPGSWGKYIFLPDGEEHPTVIEHEIAHVRLKHSRDIIWVSLLQTIFWPNLFIHILRKEITLVHEFQADGAVNANGDDYSKLLLSSVFATCTLPLSHSFIIHPVKRRIMMLKNRHKPSKALRAIVTLSLVALVGGVVTLQSCEQTKQAQEVEVITQDQMGKLTKMPEYQGKLTDFFIKNVKYPQEAMEQNVEGKVVVKFIIDEMGQATNMEVITENANPLLAQAALDAMDKMPSWTPGEIDGEPVKVQMYLPFSFKLPPPPPPPSSDGKEVSRIYDAKKEKVNAYKRGEAFVAKMDRNK